MKTYQEAARMMLEMASLQEAIDDSERFKGIVDDMICDETMMMIHNICHVIEESKVDGQLEGQGLSHMFMILSLGVRIGMEMERHE